MVPEDVEGFLLSVTEAKLTRQIAVLSGETEGGTTVQLVMGPESKLILLFRPTL